MLQGVGRRRRAARSLSSNVGAQGRRYAWLAKVGRAAAGVGLACTAVAAADLCRGYVRGEQWVRRIDACNDREELAKSMDTLERLWSQPPVWYTTPSRLTLGTLCLAWAMASEKLGDAAAGDNKHLAWNCLRTFATRRFFAFPSGSLCSKIWQQMHVWADRPAAASHKTLVAAANLAWRMAPDCLMGGDADVMGRIGDLLVYPAHHGEGDDEDDDDDASSVPSPVRIRPVLFGEGNGNVPPVLAAGKKGRNNDAAGSSSSSSVALQHAVGHMVSAPLAIAEEEDPAERRSVRHGIRRGDAAVGSAGREPGEQVERRHTTCHPWRAPRD
jgi:hypothetical protein